VGQVIAFWILAVAALGAAIGVVASRNVFRTAVLLLGCFLAIAGVYILLKADFLAAVQILIYVGAIGILIVLAIMMTHEITHGSKSNRFVLPALPIVAASLGGIIYAALNTKWQIYGQASKLPLDTASTATIANRIFGENGFVLPLEIIPILLVTTVISAIVLVKVKKK